MTPYYVVTKTVTVEHDTVVETEDEANALLSALLSPRDYDWRKGQPIITWQCESLAGWDDGDEPVDVPEPEDVR